MSKQNLNIKQFVLLGRFARICGFLILVITFLGILPPIPTIDNTVIAEGNYLYSEPQTPATLSFSLDNSIQLQGDLNENFVTSAIATTTTTDNYAGYELHAQLTTENASLVHTINNIYEIPSISTTYTQTNFPTGYWGVSADNINYRPLPTSQTTAFNFHNGTIATTSETANLYVGLKISNSQASGDYTNTINISAAPNIATYNISFNANTTDAVTNLPQTQTGTVSSVSQTIISTAPSRVGYNFLGWSETSSAATDSFLPGDTFYLDETKDNSNITLYAIWEKLSYTISFNVAAESAGYGTVDKGSITASYGDAVLINNNTITINTETITATPAVTTTQYEYTFSSWTNNCGQTITNTCAITANFTQTARHYDPVTSGLIAEYLFDDSNGTDTSGGANNITFSGVSYTTGANGSGHAVKFAGSTSSFGYANNILPYNGNPFSISFFSKSSVSTWSSILTTTATSWLDKGIYLSNAYTGAIEFGGTYGNSSTPNFDVASSNDTNDGTWHHYVVSWTGDTTSNGVKIYVDGSLYSSATALSTLAKHTCVNYMFFGVAALNDNARTSSSYRYFVGDAHEIDSFRIYNRVLSADEVTQQYYYDLQ